MEGEDWRLSNEILHKCINTIPATVKGAAWLPRLPSMEPASSKVGLRNPHHYSYIPCLTNFFVEFFAEALSSMLSFSTCLDFSYLKLSLVKFGTAAKAEQN